MTNPLVERLRDLAPYSSAWFAVRDELAAKDAAAYRQWLDDEWRTDRTLAGIERLGVKKASDGD